MQMRQIKIESQTTIQTHEIVKSGPRRMERMVLVTRFQRRMNRHFRNDWLVLLFAPDMHAICGLRFAFFCLHINKRNNELPRKNIKQMTTTFGANLCSITNPYPNLCFYSFWNKINLSMQPSLINCFCNAITTNNKQRYYLTLTYGIMNRSSVPSSFFFCGKPKCIKGVCTRRRALNPPLGSWCLPYIYQK